MKQKKRVARLKRRQADYDKMIQNPRNNYAGFKKPGSLNK